VKRGRRRYAVITPARDEAANLPRVAECLAAQTVPPAAWVIVENGSHDETAAVAADIATRLPFASVATCRGTAEPERGAPIVEAFESGFATVADEIDVVVNVDADISFGARYFEQLLSRFDEDAELGIASGTCYERARGRWRERHVTGSTVWGASRAYRRRCLDELLPLERRLGWDGLDELKANARGWRTATFEDLPFFHHRSEGVRDGAVARARATQGRSAYYMGYRPGYLLLRALYHAVREPAALAMVWGYAAAWIQREPRFDDAPARRYLRRQQSIVRLPLRALEARGRRRPARLSGGEGDDARVFVRQQRSA
jgi:biofilm PGA synthesis N-glycosyltransferase PgaC